ncbi:hypothetical protein DH2020_020626 [Rehmannia glutinosa]|uniref:Uncharacterized protein n=1 Tax=Rehmannia glutinosa TaxID=99300 RepID=A0ABR0WKB3_REHGL
MNSSDRTLGSSDSSSSTSSSSSSSNDSSSDPGSSANPNNVAGSHEILDVDPVRAIKVVSHIDENDESDSGNGSGGDDPLVDPDLEFSVPWALLRSIVRSSEDFVKNVLTQNWFVAGKLLTEDALSLADLSPAPKPANLTLDRPPPVPKPEARGASSSQPHTTLEGIPFELQGDPSSGRATSQEPVLPPSHSTPRQVTSHEAIESSKPRDKSSKSHKDKSQKDKTHKGKSSSSRYCDPREPSSSKKLRIDPEVEVSSWSELDEQLAWLERCETQLANLCAAKRNSTPQALSRPFEASLPRKVPNWFINGRSTVLETHAEEDSFELYKHTLLATDQFALTSTDFTRLEELIAHNNFMDLDRLTTEAKHAKTEKEKAINDACSKLAQENSTLKTEVQDITSQLTKAREDLEHLKKTHELERQQSFDLGRTQAAKEFLDSEDFKSATHRARLNGVEAFLGSLSFETLVARRAAKGAYKEEFDLNLLDPFEEDEGDAGVDVEATLGSEETEEMDEFSELVRPHLAASDRAPGGNEDGAEA